MYGFHSENINRTPAILNHFVMIWKVCLLRKERSKNICKQRLQPSKSLASNGFVGNNLQKIILALIIKISNCSVIWMLPFWSCKVAIFDYFQKESKSFSLIKGAFLLESITARPWDKRFLDSKYSHNHSKNVIKHILAILL